MLDLLGVTANVAAVIDLLVKAGVMCSIYCRDVKHAPRDIRLILTEADKLSATLKDVDRLVSGPNRNKFDSSLGLRTSINDCRAMLVELVATLEEGSRQKRLVWPFKKYDVAKAVERLERSRAVMSLDLSVKQTDIVLDLHQKVVLTNLRVVKGATYESGIDAYGARCHPGTRQDVLKQIQTWCEDRSGPGIFWLNGMAGTGKSTISRTVAQSLADEGKLGASFFFKRGEGDRGRTSLFVTTIAAQLAQTLPSVAPHIRDVVDADPTINDRSMRDQFKALISDPINAVPWHSHAPLVVVIDALDESEGDSSMRELISIISQRQLWSSGRLKFFLTSRPELPIRIGFSEIGGNYEDTVLHEMSPSTIAYDIGQCLRHRLGIIRRDYNNSVMANRMLPSNWPGEEDIQKMINMAIPLFIFVATACRFLEDRRLGSPKDQLVRVLRYQNTQPSQMDIVYLPIIDRLLVGLSSLEMEEVVQKFKYIVGSIVTLEDPLSINSLSKIIDVTTDSIEDVLDLLHSVLRVPLDLDTPVRLLHLSFRGFLTDPEKGRDQTNYPFWIDEQAAHLKLAEGCLQLLSKDGNLRQDICGLHKPGIQRADIPQQTIDDNISPAVRYASIYWVHHVRQSGTQLVDGDSIFRFLSRHLLHWLEILSLLGEFWVGAKMVYEFLDILDPSSSPDTFALLQDISRCFYRMGSIFETAPLQIYSSALILAPERSSVRNMFHADIPDWLTSISEVESDWDACLAVVDGQGHNLVSTIFSTNSETFTCVSGNGAIQTWNKHSGNCLVSQEDPHQSYSIAMSPDSQRIISLSTNTAVKTWDFTSKILTSEVKIRESQAEVCKLSHDGARAVLGYGDGALVGYDIETGNTVATYEGLDDKVAHVEFSADKTRILSLSRSGTAAIWNAADGNCLAIYKYSPDRITFEALSSDGNMIAWSVDDRIDICDALTGKCLTKCQAAGRALRPALFTDDGETLISAADKVIWIWETKGGSMRTRCWGHHGAITSFSLMSCGEKFASASTDKTVKVWTRFGSVHLATFTGHTDWVTRIIFSPDDSKIASTSLDRSVRIWDATRCLSHSEQRAFRGKISAAIFSPDHTRLAIITTNGTLQIWDTASGNCIATHDGHTDLTPPILILAPHRVSDPADCLVTSENTENGPNSRFQSVVFSPDSKKIVSRKGHGTITLLDATTGECAAAQYCSDGFFIELMLYSPDNRKLVIITRHVGITVWDTANSRFTHILTTESDPRNYILSAEISPDANKLVTTVMSTFEMEDIVKIWDLSSPSETCIATCKSDCKEVNFSPDSSRVAMAPGEGSLRIWDLALDKIILIPGDHSGRAKSIAFCMKGACILSLCNDYTVKLFNVQTGDCIDTVKVGKFVDRISVDPSGLLFTTAMGTFTIEHMPCVISSTTIHGGLEKADLNCQAPRISQQGIGISVCGQWVTWKSQNVVWLPRTRHPGVSDASMSTVAIGSPSGELTMLSIQAVGDLA